MSDREKDEQLKSDFQEQYAQMKQEEEEKKEKRKVIILLIIFVLTLIASIFGATYSYLTIRNGAGNIKPVDTNNYVITNDGRTVRPLVSGERVLKDKYGNVIIPEGGATITDKSGNTITIPRGSVVTCEGNIVSPSNPHETVSISEEGELVIPKAGAQVTDIHNAKTELKPGTYPLNCKLQSEGSQMITIVYTDTTEYEVANITPGWESETAKTFTIRCEGTATGYYKVRWADVVNEFTHPEDLVYTVKVNGIAQKENVPAPTEDGVFLENVSIAAGGVQNYEITFKYLYRETSQDEDQDKSFAAKIQVDVEE